MKVFGKEPAFWVGTAEALIVVIVAFGVSQELGVVLTTLAVAIGGVLTAYAAKDTLLAALLAVVRAGAGLVVYLGYDLSDAQIASILGLTTIVLGGWLRSQTSSTDTAVSVASDGLYGNVPRVVGG